MAQFLGYDMHEFREKLNEEISELDLFSENTSENRAQSFDRKEKIELISLLYLGVKISSLTDAKASGSSSFSVFMLFLFFFSRVFLEKETFGPIRGIQGSFEDHFIKYMQSRQLRASDHNK